MKPRRWSFSSPRRSSELVRKVPFASESPRPDRGLFVCARTRHWTKDQYLDRIVRSYDSVILERTRGMRRPAIACVICVCLCIMEAGCGGAPSLMSTPNLYTHGDVDPFPDVPPSLQNNHAEVLYMTDRKPEEPNEIGQHYGYKRSRSVAVGVCDVEFGHDVSWEQLNVASRTSDREVKLPVKIVSIKEIVRFPETPRILMALPPLQPAPTQPTTQAAAM